MRISIEDIVMDDVVGWTNAPDVAGTLPQSRVAMRVDKVEKLDADETSPELGGYKLYGEILGEENSPYSEGPATVKLPQKKVTVVKPSQNR